MARAPGLEALREAHAARGAGMAGQGAQVVGSGDGHTGQGIVGGLEQLEGEREPARGEEPRDHELCDKRVGARIVPVRRAGEEGACVGLDLGRRRFVEPAAQRPDDLLRLMDAGRDVSVVEQRRATPVPLAPFALGGALGTDLRLEAEGLTPLVDRAADQAEQRQQQPLRHGGLHDFPQRQRIDAPPHEGECERCREQDEVGAAEAADDARERQRVERLEGAARHPEHRGRRGQQQQDQAADHLARRTADPPREPEPRCTDRKLHERALLHRVDHFNGQHRWLIDALGRQVEQHVGVLEKPGEHDELERQAEEARLRGERQQQAQGRDEQQARRARRSQGVAQELHAPIVAAIGCARAGAA